MISKRSFIKLLKDDARKRSWLWILSILMFCLLFPGVVLDNFQGMRALNEERETASHFLSALVYGGKQYYLLSVGFLAVSCALSGFSYLHSRSKLDFYHSLPVRRGTWLALQFVSSFLICAVPMMFQAVVEIFIGMVYQAVNGQTILVLAGNFCLYLLIFLGVYFLCVLAVLMTGKLLVSCLLIPVLFCFTALAALIFRMFKRTFYRAYIPAEPASLFEKSPAPITLMQELVKRWSDFVERGMTGSFPLKETIGLALFVTVLIFLNNWLYRNRKTESAGSAVVFPGIAAALELLMAVTVSLGAGIFLKTFSYTQSDVWFFGGIAVGIFLLTAVMDFIYCADIRGVLKNPAILLVTAAVAFGAALVFRFDLLGYDTYLPGRNKVASMSVDNYDLSNVYQQVLSYSDKASSSTVGHDTKATLDSYQMTEFEPIYAMAENGRENARNKREQSLSVDLTSVNIRYNLTDGRVVYRSYWVDHDVFEENAKKLYAKPGFIKAMYPVFNKNSMDVEAVCANGVDIGTGYNYFESDEQRERFVSAYKEELLTLRYEELDGEELLGWLTISYRGRAERDYGLTAEGFITDEDSGYPVLRRFTKTTAVLKELGISFMDTLEPDEVRELSVWRGEGNETLELLAVEAGEPDLITDRQKQELLDMLSFRYCTGDAGGEDTYYITAYGIGGRYLQTFVVPSEDLPAEILEILKEHF